MASRAVSPRTRLLSKAPLPAVALAMRLALHLPPGLPPIGRARAVAARLGTVVSRVNQLEAVFVPTRLMGSVLERHGVRRSKLIHAPFGIDPIASPPRRPRDVTGGLRVGYIGSLAEHKGVHVLLQAARGMPTTNMEVRVYGSPDHFPAYAASLRGIAAGDQRISFMGTFPNKEIGEVFAGLDVLVIPSVWHENTPLVIASAQACGCPIVASDVAGISEAVSHGEDGLLFPPGDVAALRGSLERLTTDATLLERLTASQRPPRTTADYVDQLEDAYRERGRA
jgi:glycosyltransferase involved in cell wall biosynthesis